MRETTEELLQRIQLGESSSLELKDLRYRANKILGPGRKDMADEFAAMANASGGTVVLGVDDKSRTITGIPRDKLASVDAWIQGICTGLVKPSLNHHVEKIPVVVDDGEERVIVRIDIPRGEAVHSSPGGYFRREGTSKIKLEPPALARLIQQRGYSGIVRFDEQAVRTAPKSCLEKDLWERFRSPLTLDDDEVFLHKLQFLISDQDGEARPSVGGILMACSQPQEFLQSAFIQAVCYRGTTRDAAHQIDARDIVGPLDVQITDAYHFVNKNMKVYAVKEPWRRDIPQYSKRAVFEAIVNAVAHRDYSVTISKIRLHMFSDRLELFSPGKLLNSLTVDSLHLRQAHRNELITGLLSRCPVTISDLAGSRTSIMEKRGEGVPIIYAESEELSGRRPVYQLLDDAELLLTIFAAPLPHGTTDEGDDDEGEPEPLAIED